MLLEKYAKQLLNFNRQAVIASATVTKDKNAIHLFTEIETVEPESVIKIVSGRLEKSAHLFQVYVRTLSLHETF